MRKTNWISAAAGMWLAAIATIPNGIAGELHGPWKAELQKGNEAVRFEFKRIVGYHRLSVFLLPFSISAPPVSRLSGK